MTSRLFCIWISVVFCFCFFSFEIDWKEHSITGKHKNPKSPIEITLVSASTFKGITDTPRSLLQDTDLCCSAQGTPKCGILYCFYLCFPTCQNIWRFSQCQAGNHTVTGIVPIIPKQISSLRIEDKRLNTQPWTKFVSQMAQFLTIDLQVCQLKHCIHFNQS